MLMEKERNEIVKYLKKLATSNLTVGTAGNISVYNPDAKLMAISPSGMDYDNLTPDDVVVMDLNNNVVEGNKKPSSEYAMHSIFYKNRPNDINAVVHTHSPYACILACLNWNLEPCTYTLARVGNNVRCTKYETYGTEELAKTALEGMKDRYAVLLANHGQVAGALTLKDAYANAETVEFCSMLYYKCKCVGEPVILNQKQMDITKEKLATYGQK